MRGGIPKGGGQGHTLLPQPLTLGQWVCTPVNSLQARWKGESPEKESTRRNPFILVPLDHIKPLGHRHEPRPSEGSKRADRVQGFEGKSILENGGGCSRRLLG